MGQNFNKLDFKIQILTGQMMISIDGDAAFTQFSYGHNHYFSLMNFYVVAFYGLWHDVSL